MVFLFFIISLLRARALCVCVRTNTAHLIFTAQSPKGLQQRGTWLTPIDPDHFQPVSLPQSHSRGRQKLKHTGMGHLMVQTPALATRLADTPDYFAKNGAIKQCHLRPAAPRIEQCLVEPSVLSNANSGRPGKAFPSCRCIQNVCIAAALLVEKSWEAIGCASMK